MIFQTSYLFSQDRAWDIPEARGLKDAIVPGLIAGGEILLVNGMFTFTNWLAGWDWAVPSVESIRFNFTNPWQWETDDGFIVNQLGHPFQGSLYFNAGRVNGFGFYQNVFFGMLGSISWETSFENKHAALNDIFVTIPGSLPAGEISYRLYLEAHAAGVPAPLAFFLSPAAGLHRLLTDWEPPDAGRNMHELRYFLGAAYAQNHSSISGGQEELFSYNGPLGDLGLKLVYGNPFEQETFVPFRHFEFALSYGMNPGRYHDIRLASDGYLFSFSPVQSGRHILSTGLTLHLDFNARGRFHIHDSTINHYSNALNWTAKYQQLLSPDTAMQIKGHAGFTFMGASKYYSPEIEDELNNYGYGLNSKLFFNLENRKAGRLEADLSGYVMWNYPGTSALSHGTVFWLFSDIAYSRFVSERVSLGIRSSRAREWGSFFDHPNTRKRDDSPMVFVAWNL
ncbi:MAG: DUF3943 domain-containing protein [Treponema sp.]|nr:DUF3943 domain-containing protein [Treponema sp.]